MELSYGLKPHVLYHRLVGVKVEVIFIDKRGMLRVVGGLGTS